MYKGFKKSENIVGMIFILFALIYRVLADHAKIYIPDTVVFIVMFVFFGYLFFNRVVTLAIEAAKVGKAPYETFFTIDAVRETTEFGSTYKFFDVSYTDADNKRHTKEIHNAFSVKKWKVGDKIRIKVSRDDPERIIIPSSDIFLAVLMSLIGIAAETAAVAVYLLALKNK